MQPERACRHSQRASFQTQYPDAHMNASQGSIPADRDLAQSTAWRELWLKEDWWAVWLGLALVVAAYFLFANGSSLKWIGVTCVIACQVPEEVLGELVNWTRYLAQF